jgi:hypothetical protein
MTIDDVYRPFLLYFRRRRMRRFISLFDVEDATSIIDLGGTEFVWRLVAGRPRVTMINVGVEEWAEGRLRMLDADATAVPFSDDAFDVCFSNSVIEHVGNEQMQAAFAREVRRLAQRYWVQTPNRRFFLEPHLICLFLHWLPFRLERRLVRYFSLWGLISKPAQADIDRFIQGIRLLDEAAMRRLFPDAEIFKERFLGFAKSLIAVRSARPRAAAARPAHAGARSPRRAPPRA